MDIEQIAKTVEQNVQGDRLSFSDETVGVHYITKLFYYHMSGQRSFMLAGVTYGLEAGVFRLAGSGTLPDGTVCHVVMTFAKEEDGSLQVNMQEQYLLAFPGIKFGCICSYRTDMWRVIFKPGGDVGFSEVVSGSLLFLGVEVSAACFGDMGRVSALRFQFELPFTETGLAERNSFERETFMNINLENYFSLAFETDTKLDLSGVFEGGNQVALEINAFFFEKFGSKYGFSFRGTINIWSLVIPFTIRYDGQMFLLSTRKEDKSSLGIPSVRDLGGLVGIEDLNFPDSLCTLEAFKIESVSLAVSADFKRLISFDVVVSNPNSWQLAQTPDIHIENLKVGFAKNSSGNTVFIGGDFTFDEWVVTLSSAYHTQAGWIFQCYIANDQKNPLDLSELFNKLCAYLGFQEIPFPLPDLTFIGAMVSFGLKTKQFSAKIEIGKLICDFSFMPQQSYALDLQVGYEIFLEELPVVGTDLHLLDGVVIRDIRLQSSAQRTVLQLDFAGKILELELAKASSEPVMQEGSCYDANAGGLKLLWFRLERKFSAFTIHRIGLGFDGQTITFAFDAELAAGAFQVAVEGMGVSVRVAERIMPSFDLAGLSVGFRNPMLSVSGGFRHLVSGEAESYDGALLIAAKAFSIRAVGSYSDGSFLAYGILRTKMGGPPALSVTGLAVGFGLNKYLELPAIEEVKAYPFVAAAMDPGFTVGELLDGIKSKITTLPGQNFLAAGLSFCSFGMAVSFVLLTVSFGKHMEIGVLGLSELTVPPMTKKDPIAKATLALKAAVLPEIGVVSVEAQLMEDSYLLSRNCRLTGGFAFYLWFAGMHKGDFVITLGGYRKGYCKPEYYPDVPRLGFSWCAAPGLMLRGELYFALTPAMVCAGGKLEAVFEMGALRAWFTAYTDITIGWKPFYYELTVGIGLGASITLDLWLFSMTFTLEMAVDLYIKGPEFGGRARIKWWVISFTIAFGEQAEVVEAIEWDEFKKTFLQEEIISIQAAEGKIGTVKITERGKEKEIDVLHADTARIMVESLVPSSEVTVNGKENFSGTAGLFGVLPMGDTRLYAPLSVNVSEKGYAQAFLFGDCKADMITQNVPKALWAAKNQSKGYGEEDGELIKNAVTGVSLKFPSKAFTTFPVNSFLTLDVLSEYEKTEKAFTHTSVWEQEIEGIDTEFKVFREAAKEIPSKVSAFAKEMEKNGFQFAFSPDLTVMAANAKSLFEEEIRISGGRAYGTLD